MASKILCVRPSCFAYDEDTASTNSFQSAPSAAEVVTIRCAALREFDAAVSTLEGADIELIVAEDTSAVGGPCTPDSVFPNNWFSTHRLCKDEDREMKVLVLYPMCGVNRRLERTGPARKLIESMADTVVDMTGYEARGLYLEGTGSLVLDRERKVCYAALSPRTEEGLVQAWANRMGYKAVCFRACRLSNGEPIYHTNVMMSIGTDWIVICLEVISDAVERARLLERLSECGKRIIELTSAQLDSFCGNVLAVRRRDGSLVTVMSRTAHDAFRPEQLAPLGTVVVVDISTIERIGGGSARCMLAEVYF